MRSPKRSSRNSGAAERVDQTILKTAAEEIIASVPSEVLSLAAHQSHTDSQTDYLLDLVGKQISQIIVGIDKEVVDYRTFMDAVAESFVTIRSSQDRERLKAVDEIVGAMWRSGIFATRGSSGATWSYVWSAGELRFTVPAPNSAMIGFHASMIDYVGLRGVSDVPVF